MRCTTSAPHGAVHTMEWRDDLTVSDSGRGTLANGQLVGPAWPSWGLRFRIVSGVFETAFAVLLIAALGGLNWSRPSWCFVSPCSAGDE